MPKLLDVLTIMSISSDSEYNHTLHVLSLQENASAEDPKNKKNASYDFDEQSTQVHRGLYKLALSGAGRGH